MIPPDERLRRHHNRRSHCSWHTPAALSRYGGRAATRCWPRGHARGGTPAPPQSSRPACFTISSGAVAPRRRPPHCHHYQHTASRRATAEPPWWGTSAVSSTLALTSGALTLTGHTAQVIDSMRSKSRYDRFLG
jgi:hypothetical protein